MNNDPALFSDSGIFYIHTGEDPITTQGSEMNFFINPTTIHE